jgi:hypothetical protein
MGRARSPHRQEDTVFQQDSRTRYRVLQWVALKGTGGYWLCIGTGYRGADGTIDATCAPLSISRHLRLVEIAPGDADDLTTSSGWPGSAANGLPLLNSACRSARPRRMPRLARMERAR